MSIVLRAASPQDAKDVATLVNIAGEGFPAAIWSGMCELNENAIDVGARLALRENAHYSFQNAIIAELDGEVAGLVMAHNTAESPEPMNTAAHPSLRPLTKLENQALGTRYITALATYQHFRGQGIAKKLVESAERQPGRNGMSLIMTNGNRSGLRFYMSLGYRDAAQAPVIKMDWDTDSTLWHLLRKP